MNFILHKIIMLRAKLMLNWHVYESCILIGWRVASSLRRRILNAGPRNSHSFGAFKFSFHLMPSLSFLFTHLPRVINVFLLWIQLWHARRQDLRVGSDCLIQSAPTCTNSKFSLIKILLVNHKNEISHYIISIEF